MTDEKQIQAKQNQKGTVMPEEDSASPTADSEAPAAKKTPSAAATAKQKALAKELWERLAKSRPGPSNKDLMYLARFVPLLSTAAVKTLLGRSLTLEELKELIQHVPKSQESATKLLVKVYGEELTEDDLRFIFTQTKSIEIGKYLLKKYPNDANLGLAERMTDDLIEVVEKMRKQEPTKAILREIDRKL